MINAVMLGTIAGTGALPIPAEAFEAAIRADGKAVNANLRGFRAGFEAARGGSRASTEPLEACAGRFGFARRRSKPKSPPCRSRRAPS